MAVVERVTVDATGKRSDATPVKGYGYTEYGFEGHSDYHARLSSVVDNAASVKKTVYLFAKRVMDVVLSLIGLIVLSPLLLLVAVAIKLDSKGPVFFIHMRIGQNGSKLPMYKFRSMVTNAQELLHEFTPEQKKEFEENYKLDDDPRLTRIGPFLRKTSLDELPQLVNVLKGDLSIVGPRPLVEKEIEKYGENKQLLLSAKPGITGYWQVNGRNDVTYAERISLELYYIERASLWMDIKIILKTVWVVYQKTGAK